MLNLQKIKTLVALMAFISSFAVNAIAADTKSSLVLNYPNIVADIVDKVGPAVVNIDVTKIEKNSTLNPFSDFDRNFGYGFDLDPEFRHFFEEKMIPLKGSGSGFIINKNGHILTNEHVVGKASKIKVTLKDGRIFQAKVIGSDPTLDIAVIKIDATDLPAIKLGDSNKLRAGQFIIAIGNPYEFSNTVTLGIVSALGRDLNGLGKRHLIQTDAAINPGNSGGPLINLEGEVVGINAAIATGAQGIGFATPINDAKEVLDELIHSGKVSRPWLGIYMRDVDNRIAEYLELPFSDGVVVTDVAVDSPAGKAGLRRYDVITKMDGKKISASVEVQKLIREHKIGDTISIEVFRDGHKETIDARFGEAPKE